VIGKNEDDIFSTVREIPEFSTNRFISIFKRVLSTFPQIVENCLCGKSEKLRKNPFFSTAPLFFHRFSTPPVDV
jgi:hypothetical protein